MINDLVSIIIPAYNVDRYISRCIDSVINQTYRKLEILVIDDGSTDQTGKICDAYADNDERIRVFHQNNRGLSVARNCGIDHAQGEWIYFLDSDDWIDNHAIEILVNVGKKKAASIVSCLSRVVIEGENCSDSSDYKSEVEIINYPEIILGLLKQDKIRFEVWNKLWKRTIIGEERFIEGQISEDVHFDRIVFGKAQRIYCVNEKLHYYLIDRPGNTCSTYKKDRICVFDEFRLWCSELEDNNRLSSIMAIIAAKFAINMYEQAFQTKQSAEVKEEILQEFAYFYYLIECSLRKKELAIRIFHFSPRAFILISKIRRGITDGR